MDKINLPKKIIYVNATLIDPITIPSYYSWPKWYEDCKVSPNEFKEKYNATVSNWYDSYSRWLGKQIEFYDLEKYTEFYLTWM